MLDQGDLGIGGKHASDPAVLGAFAYSCERVSIGRAYIRARLLHPWNGHRKRGPKAKLPHSFRNFGSVTIPTYLSGYRSMEVLSQDPKIDHDVIAYHFGWGVTALVMLALASLAALYSLWRCRRAERLSENAVHLVLGLAVVTVGLMVVADEFGWRIAHHELLLEPATQKTPQLWSHVHIILNHFPTVGFVFAFGVFVAALALNNAVMKQGGLLLFVMCAILIVPTFVTGNASMLALTEPEVAGISKAVINAHRDLALLTLVGLAFTGVTAWIELWRYRNLGRFSKGTLYLVLVFAIISVGIMAETGHRGGQINHPEIRVATEVLPTEPNAG